MKIDSKAKIEMHRFFSRKEEKCFIVWTESKNNFIELSTESFDALNLVKKGLKIIDVKNVLEEKYGEPFDVSDFVEELVELGFVKSIDKIPVELHSERKTSLSFIKKKQVVTTPGSRHSHRFIPKDRGIGRKAKESLLGKPAERARLGPLLLEPLGSPSVVCMNLKGEGQPEVNVRQVHEGPLH